MRSICRLAVALAFSTAAVTGIAGLWITATAQSGAQEPSKLPVVKAEDREALLEHLGQRVMVVGHVKEATWSNTGKVMNIEFAGAEGRGLLAVVFSQNRRQFDEAFAGDLAKALSGAELRLDGDIELYGGYSQAYKGRPQMILRSPEEITIVEPEPRARPRE